MSVNANRLGGTCVDCGRWIPPHAGTFRGRGLVHFRCDEGEGAAARKARRAMEEAHERLRLARRGDDLDDILRATEEHQKAEREFMRASMPAETYERIYGAGQ